LTSYTLDVFHGADPAPRQVWRWRLVCQANGKIVATSGEPFDSKANALRAGVKLIAGIKQGGLAIYVDQKAVATVSDTKSR
jgi:uncharacterized protein YegP (UPF0339 family)